MRGEWREVARSYESNEGLRFATIIQTGDTMLHLAVSSGVESTVKLFIGGIPEKYGIEILKVENERGDTPLHLAAALGMRKACSAMAAKCPELVTRARNKKGETPLFTAARHGQKKAFLAMLGFAPDATSDENDDLAFCRNFVGDSILHVALFEEHYGT